MITTFGTNGTPLQTWEDFQRYARHLADDPMMLAGLANDLLTLAARDVQRVAGTVVTVFTRDGRPAYYGTVTAPGKAGRYEVKNLDTGETVAVPAYFVRPYGRTNRRTNLG
jgi:hypothetical protein